MLSRKVLSFKRTVTITLSGSSLFTTHFSIPHWLSLLTPPYHLKKLQRTFECDSTPASLPSSPPHKKSAPAFQSPNREHLREVLQSGGTADLDAQQGKFI
ncbi:hypothetical protein CY34DRAFT_99784 [Suillus luteus UH-Slu-Lm8-n1]|uniref:Uncharacterized protein n=1 Tax=Suillus luteus UH-Slu-Lm8-n1 TaxID=930992 RepID=A0A0D0AMQ3_9AGAM|nr:hypothetical protein CY34DRAFT_99784 [Suillus luteus UH-Slu-Lm8-n1]